MDLGQEGGGWQGISQQAMTDTSPGGGAYEANEEASLLHPSLGSLSGQVSQNTCSSWVSSNEVSHSSGKRAGPNKGSLLLLPCIKPSSLGVEKQPSAILHAQLLQEKPSCTPFIHTSLHKAHTPRQAGHSQDTWSVPAPALGPGLGQVVQQSASESNRLPLMLLEHLPQVSLLSTPELHQSLVASELLQWGHNHLCRTVEQRQAGLALASSAGAPHTLQGWPSLLG